jgi:hypothetical protein
MAENPTNDPHNQTNPNTPNTTEPSFIEKFGWWIGGAILIVGIVIAVYFIFIKKTAPKTAENSQNSIDEIQNAFLPTSTPSLSPPLSTSSPVTTNIPTTTPITQPTSTPATVPAPETQFNFRSNALKFSFNLPNGWQEDVMRDSEHSIAFINNSLQKQGFVEVYENTSGETISSAEAALQGSPSVISVTKTTLNGQPALFFKGANGYQDGVVTLSGGRIYYIRGDLAHEPALAGFLLIP